MDLSKFKTSDWLKVGGGLGFLIFGFVSWAKLGSASGGNAFDWFFTGGISWVLVVGVGVVAFLLAGGMLKPSGLPWPLIMLIASGLATLLMLIRVIVGVKSCESFGGEEFCVEFDRGIGLYLSFLATIASAAGSFLGFKESGGELSDLTNMDKMKNSFNTGGGSGGGTPPPPPPPPPPPGATPPPPPPPPL